MSDASNGVVEDADAVDEAWADEIDGRVAHLRSGRVQTIPGEAVLKELEDLTTRAPTQRVR